MQPWVIDLFGQIEDRQLDDILGETLVFLPEQLPATLRHNNLKDERELSFAFPIPPLQNSIARSQLLISQTSLATKGKAACTNCLVNWVGS